MFIQPLQGGIRALIVDKCPAAQQAQASAYASLMTGVGNIVGYLFGFVSLKTIFPFLDITQFTWLCLVASLAVISSLPNLCICQRRRSKNACDASAGE
jgi:solute carrier family 45 protein 1/2/4